MVPKGWIALDWNNEFENHGPFILGERDPDFIATRAASRLEHWEYTNKMWPVRYADASRFYREMLDLKPASMLVTGLIEDGCIEKDIPQSVQAFAGILWNPATSDQLLAGQSHT